MDPHSRNVYNKTGIKEYAAFVASQNDYSTKSAIMSCFLKNTVFWQTFDNYIFRKSSNRAITDVLDQDIINKYGAELLDQMVNSLYWKMKSWLFDWLKQQDRAEKIRFRTMFLADCKNLKQYIDCRIAEKLLTEGPCEPEEVEEISRNIEDERSMRSTKMITSKLVPSILYSGMNADTSLIGHWKKDYRTETK